MKIKQELLGEAAVLRLSGQLMGGPDAEQVRESILALLEQGRRKVILDLREVSWVNSTGLGILISGHIAMANQGGALGIVNISKRIESIFAVTRLDTVFDVYGDEGAALAGRPA